MNLNKNDTGTLKFGDGTSARVKIVNIEHSRSGMFPTDYWLEYEEDETNRKIIHPDFGKLDIIKSSILLPETLLEMVFTKNSYEEPVIDEYEKNLDAHLTNHFNPENRREGRQLFKRLESIMSREEIIKNYFNK